VSRGPRRLVGLLRIQVTGNRAEIVFPFVRSEPSFFQSYQMLRGTFWYRLIKNIRRDTAPAGIGEAALSQLTSSSPIRGEDRDALPCGRNDRSGCELGVSLITVRDSGAIRWTVRASIHLSKPF